MTTSQTRFLKKCHKKQCSKLINRGTKKEPDIVTVLSKSLRDFALQSLKSTDDKLAGCARHWMSVKMANRSNKRKIKCGKIFKAYVPHVSKSDFR